MCRSSTRLRLGPLAGNVPALYRPEGCHTLASPLCHTARGWKDSPCKADCTCYLGPAKGRVQTDTCTMAPGRLGTTWRAGASRRPGCSLQLVCGACALSARCLGRVPVTCRGLCACLRRSRGAASPPASCTMKSASLQHPAVCLAAGRLLTSGRARHPLRTSKPVQSCRPDQNSALDNWVCPMLCFALACTVPCKAHKAAQAALRLRASGEHSLPVLRLQAFTGHRSQLAVTAQAAPRLRVSRACSSPVLWLQAVGGQGSQCSRLAHSVLLCLHLHTVLPDPGPLLRVVHTLQTDHARLNSRPYNATTGGNRCLIPFLWNAGRILRWSGGSVMAVC